ncbi:MAG: His-Xaa-Ser system radical SAM maturase HxsB [Gammaproteobacteria bacterium]|nr:MAG: His-Xaa-Ser system radical SAM maturase HxsB [Gammaproteobacteria bacterium]
MSAKLELLPFNFRQIPKLNKWLLSGPSGAFALLDSKEQLKAIADGNLDVLSSDHVNELIAKSFLSETSEREVRARLIASQMATQLAKAVSKPSLFMIIPSLRCDHDCGYCQVSRVPRDRAGYDLDDQHIEAILRAIAAVGNDRIKVEFQGGEPLLAFAFIQQFYEKGQHVLVGVDVSYVICTAGGPLSESIIDWAKDKKVDFSISLDGPQDVHIHNRPSKYFNTHKVTTAVIEQIRRTLGFHRVNSLTTISKYSLDHPTQIVNTYFDLEFPGIFLRPLSPFGFAAATQHRIGYDAGEYMAFYEAALRHIIDLNKDRTFIEDTALIHLRRIFQPHSANYIDLQSPAGYIFGALVFNYDGNIFGSDEARMLWQSTQASELVLGTVNDDMKSLVIGEAAKRLLTSSFNWATPGCDDCAYQPYCGSDPLHHLATQGDSIGHKASSFFCQYQTAMFDLLFTLWETDTNARKVFQEWLTH